MMVDLLLKQSPEATIVLAILGWLMIGAGMVWYSWAMIKEEGRPAWLRLLGWLLPLPAGFFLLLTYGTGAKFQPFEQPVLAPFILTLGWLCLAIAAVLLAQTQRRKVGLTLSALGFLLFAAKPFVQPCLTPIKVAGKYQIIPVGTFAGYHLYFWTITLALAVLSFLLWRGAFGDIKKESDSK